MQPACSRSFPTSHRRFLVSGSIPGTSRGRWKYLFQLNTCCQLPDSRGFNLDFRKHLRESLQGLLGRGDWFPVQEKRHPHCVALVRVHPAELHHLVLRLEKFFFSSENFTFWGAACSSVGGPMMFSLRKIWTHSFPLIFTKCPSFSVSTNYTL